jgi:hypothetical protein
MRRIMSTTIVELLDGPPQVNPEWLKQRGSQLEYQAAIALAGRRLHEPAPMAGPRQWHPALVGVLKPPLKSSGVDGSRIRPVGRSVTAGKEAG